MKKTILLMLFAVWLKPAIISAQGILPIHNDSAYYHYDTLTLFARYDVAPGGVLSSIGYATDELVKDSFHKWINSPLQQRIVNGGQNGITGYPVVIHIPVKKKGTYLVWAAGWDMVQNSNLCSSYAITVYVDTIYGNYTGIEEYASKGRSRLSFYPNPATDVITVRDYAPSNAIFEIYDSFGRLVKIQDLNESNEINISDLANGIYICGESHKKLLISR